MAQDGDEEDYFAHFEDLEFTEEDLAQIDRVGEEGLHLVPVSESKLGEALITIEVEQGLQPATEALSPQIPPPRNPLSEPPYDAFRRGKSLSVSDLTGPLWCELQYEYRQRQGWGLKFKDRPQKFVSREGNTIVASHTIASNNEKILKAGRVVHRRLEREIRPPQVRVDIETLEEYWATRLINMLQCLADLMEHGFCREMPVFGLTHDHIVSGIIDEISIESMQTQINGSAVVNDQVTQRSLRISDTKTRDTSTIPSERNSMQARTQLMLYHRLFSGLIQSSSDLELRPYQLDFDVFWLRIGVDPYQPFSDGFCEETDIFAYSAMTHSPEQQALPEENGDTKRARFCLNTLVDVWKRMISLLGITSVDSTLTLNYRRRMASVRNKRRRTNGPKDLILDSLEEKEFNRAIIASLDQAEREDPVLAHAIAESLRDARAMESILEQTPIQHQGPPSKQDAELDLDESGVHSGKEDQGSGLIGSTSFAMDDVALDARLEKVLEWWHGIRPPEGVELDDTGRCHSCEFSTSCEWREKKHNELVSKLRTRTRDT